MSQTQRTILMLYAAVIAIWPLRSLILAIIGRTLPRLTSDSPKAIGPDLPFVTALIPAKDEEAALAECLDSVRAQTYPNLEILVVDDRSSDGTGDIARAAAAEDPRVRLLSIEELPPGWTGKTHALHKAAAMAQGEWLWFLDADTRHSPDNLRIVLNYALREKADLVSLLADLRCESFWEQVVQPVAAVVLMQSYPLFRVNNNRDRLAFANGQYILIRRDAYDAAGGHAGVRERFVEDIAIAQRVKALGHSIRVALATGIGSTRMYTSLPQIVRGWSRILYDANNRNPWKLLLGVLDPLIFSQSGQLAFIVALGMLLFGVSTPFATALLGLSLLHFLLNWEVMRRVDRMSDPASRHAHYFPFGNLVVQWSLVRAISMCLTGRVVWRGTSYVRPVAPKRSRRATVTRV